jgi:myo-inositol-1(or 4)-monophosphatase
MSRGEQTELETLRKVAERAVLRGGEVVSSQFGLPMRSLERKGPGDYVTAVDLESDEVIRDTLDREAPGIAVVSEELGGKKEETYWCVDPLDGTRNFSLGMPAVAVSVALIVERRPVVGAVSAPLLSLCFSAGRGLGAWSGAERLAVSARPNSQAILATGFPRRDRSDLPDYLAYFESVFLLAEDVRRTGSAALDLAWVARGVFDGYFHLNLSEWDVAAGALLIEEAGGAITDWAGGPDYLRGDVLAGSPAVHRMLVEAASRSPLRERSYQRRLFRSRSTPL